MEMLLKAFTPAMSDDGQWTKLALEGDNGKQVNVMLMSNDFRGMLDSLITFHIQSEVGKALAQRNAEAQASSSEQMLPLAVDLNLVCREAGGTALQVRTADGADLQIGLTQDMTAFLREALNKQLS